MPRRFSAVVLALLIAAPALIAGPQVRAQGAPDYDLPGGNGHFFTQTDGANGATGTGFAVSNADGIPFWDYFQAAGGVQAVGYPVSHRFLWNGFTVQAFQKVVFQWRPEARTVYYVNVLDEMHNLGFDDYLRHFRATPPSADWSADAGLPFDQVIRRHLELLNANSAIAAAYYAEDDMINRNGLPMAPIQNMGDVLVLRAQRKIYQQWLVDTPWARSGQVVTANGGDVAKEANVYPAAAVVPASPATVSLSVVAELNTAGQAPTPTPTTSPMPTETATVTATAVVTPTATMTPPAATATTTPGASLIVTATAGSGSAAN